LRKLGHEVTHFETWDKRPYKNFADLNCKFLTAVREFDPDVIFCVLMHYELWLESWEEIRAGCKAVTIHWGTDDSWKYKSFTRFLAPVFDLYATTSRDAYEKALRAGYQNVILTQWAANGDALAEPLRAEDCQYDVSFVGSAYGSRPRWIRRLSALGVDVACFGHGWGSGSIESQQIPQIIRSSRICLNFCDSGQTVKGLGDARRRQIKARVFEVTGAGGLLLTEDAPYLAEFFDFEKEIVTFSNIRDLHDKIVYLLSHPGERDRIAVCGHQRTAGRHTYEDRFREIFGHARGILDARAQCSVPIGNNGPMGFCQVVERHRVGWALSFTRGMLVLMFSLFFGRQRGARAARQLVFEISWRLFRDKTYRAAGIPGRLFYRES
jgi:spore maturation protein CgeB